MENEIKKLSEIKRNAEEIIKRKQLELLYLYMGLLTINKIIEEGGVLKND